jgi:hypothetical protein
MIQTKVNIIFKNNFHDFDLLLGIDLFWEERFDAVKVFLDIIILNNINFYKDDNNSLNKKTLPVNSGISQSHDFFVTFQLSFHEIICN